MGQDERGYKVLALLALPYAISVALGWALGYWRGFGINPFEYTSPVEAASLSAYALVASLPILVLSLFVTRMLLQGPMGRTIDAWIDSRVEKTLGTVPAHPAGVEPDPEALAAYKEQLSNFGGRLRREMNKLFLMRLAVVVIAVLVATLAYLKQSSLWLGVFAFLPIFALIVADPIPQSVKDMLPRGSAAEIVLCIMIGLPVVAFLYGAQMASLVKDGKGPLLLTGTESQEVKRASVYVGRMGEYVFTYDICSKHVLVRKVSNLLEFRLVPDAVAQCANIPEVQQNSSSGGQVLQSSKMLDCKT